MTRKSVLGKGLDVLLPVKEKEDEKVNEVIKATDILDINRIKPNKNQPRKVFDDEKIQELSGSIKDNGIIQPIVVKKDPGGNDYIIVAGERRWRAAKLAGLKEVPVVLREVDDRALLTVSLIENIQRQDLNPVEEARAFKRLIEDFDMTQEEVSAKIGKSRVSVTNTLRLLNLDDRVLDYVSQGVISEGHGRALLAVEDKEIQYRTCQKIIDEAMSVRQAESYIKSFEKMKDIRGREKKKDVFLKDLEDRITTILGTKVVFKPRTKSRGRIEIEYYSSEDLERILEHLDAHE